MRRSLLDRPFHLTRKRFDRDTHIGLQALASLTHIREDRSPHPGIPEFFDVIGDACRGLVLPLASEEGTDLIGHHDELVRRHLREPPE
jgi:hypothetical protein